MKRKILFVAQNLAVGGIQTSLLNLLITIDKEHRNEYEIDLFTFGKGDFLPFVPESVNVICGKRLLNLVATPLATVLKSKKILDIFLRLFAVVYVRIIGSEAFYRKMFEKHRIQKEYSAAISYFNDVPDNYFNKGTNLFVSDYVNAGKKVAWIHTDPIKSGFNRDYCRKIYSNFDAIVCVANAVKEKFDAFLPEYKDITGVIYNVFPEKEIIKAADEYTPFEKKHFEIVTVGRVDNYTKRMDGIIRLVKRLADEGIAGFRWHIVGDGPDMKKNAELIKELGVGSYVTLVGERKNPYPYIKNADLFALYSAYEGYPMVVGEAIALGTKILSTDYAAAKEQIDDAKGIVCKSDEEFFQTLKGLIVGADKCNLV